MLRGNAKRGHEPLFVKTDDHLVADENNGYTHLTGFLYHFLTLLEVMCDVVFGIADAFFLKEIFGHLAEVARRGAVNGDGFVHVYKVIREVYHETLSTGTFGAGCENRTRARCLGNESP